MANFVQMAVEIVSAGRQLQEAHQKTMAAPGDPQRDREVARLALAEGADRMRTVAQVLDEASRIRRARGQARTLEAALAQAAGDDAAKLDEATMACHFHFDMMRAVGGKFVATFDEWSISPATDKTLRVLRRAAHDARSTSAPL